MKIPRNKIQIARHHKDVHTTPHTHSQNSTEVGTVKSGTREIKVVRRVLDVNEKMAAQNRKLFRGHGVFVLNMMSSPGSGKTSLLERTLKDLKETLDFYVIEGDQQTVNDANRISALDVPVIQILLALPEMGLRSEYGVTRELEGGGVLGSAYARQEQGHPYEQKQKLVRHL